MNAILVRYPRALWLATFIVTILAGVAMAACLSLASGCGSAAQRTVSAMAVAAVAADDANATAYEIQAREAVVDCRDSGGGFEDCWCPAMATPWERSSRAECAIESLADLALAGQHVIDAGDSLNAEWLGAACETLRALEAAWMAGDDPPELVGTTRKVVCGMGDGSRSGPPECDDPGPPPPCGVSEKCAKPDAEIVSSLWAVLAATG